MTTAPPTLPETPMGQASRHPVGCGREGEEQGRVQLALWSHPQLGAPQVKPGGGEQPEPFTASSQDRST